MDYQYLVLAHLLGFALFLMGHGVSMFFAAALRRERNVDRLRALLDLSLSSLIATYLGLLLLIASGIWLGFAGSFWGQGWIWTAIAILIAEMALMIFMGVTISAGCAPPLDCSPTGAPAKCRSVRWLPLTNSTDCCPVRNRTSLRDWVCSDLSP